MGAATERMAHFHHFIDIEAKRVEQTKAFLLVSVETDSISVVTQLYDIDVNEDNASQSSNTSDGLVGVRIDVRKMNLIFNTLKHMKPTSVTMNISDKNRIYFQFINNSFIFQSILPNIDL